MSERYHQISDDLWIDTDSIQGDGLFYVCDSVGGKTLVDSEEIPALIHALTNVAGKTDDAVLRDAVFQSIGEASMCWEEIPRGKFLDVRAAEIGNKLLKFIMLYVQEQAQYTFNLEEHLPKADWENTHPNKDE